MSDLDLSIGGFADERRDQLLAEGAEQPQTAGGGVEIGGFGDGSPTTFEPATEAIIQTQQQNVRDVLVNAQSLGISPDHLARNPRLFASQLLPDQGDAERFTIPGAWDALRSGFSAALALSKANALYGRAADGRMTYEDAKAQADEILADVDLEAGRGLLGHLYTGANILGSTIPPLAAGGLLTPLGGVLGGLAGLPAGPGGVLAGAARGATAAAALGAGLRTHHEQSGALYNELRNTHVQLEDGSALPMDHNTAASFARVGAGAIALLDVAQAIPIAKAFGPIAQKGITGLVVPLVTQRARTAVARVGVEALGRTARAGSQELALEVLQENIALGIQDLGVQALAEREEAEVPPEFDNALRDYLQLSADTVRTLAPSMFFIAGVPALGGSVTRHYVGRSARAEQERMHGAGGDTTAYFDQGDEPGTVDISVEQLEPTDIETVGTERTAAKLILAETAGSEVKLLPVEVEPAGEGRYALTDKTQAGIVEALRDSGYQSLRVVDVQERDRAAAEEAAAADEAAEQETAEGETREKPPPKVETLKVPIDSIEGRIGQAFPQWSKQEVRTALLFLQTLARREGIPVAEFVDQRLTETVVQRARLANMIQKAPPRDDAKLADVAPPEMREEIAAVLAEPAPETREDAADAAVAPAPSPTPTEQPTEPAAPQDRGEPAVSPTPAPDPAVTAATQPEPGEPGAPAATEPTPETVEPGRPADPAVAAAEQAEPGEPGAPAPTEPPATTAEPEGAPAPAVAAGAAPEPGAEPAPPTAEEPTPDTAEPDPAAAPAADVGAAPPEPLTADSPARNLIAAAPPDVQAEIDRAYAEESQEERVERMRRGMPSPAVEAIVRQLREERRAASAQVAGEAAPQGPVREGRQPVAPELAEPAAAETEATGPAVPEQEPAAPALPEAPAPEARRTPAAPEARPRDPQSVAELIDQSEQEALRQPTLEPPQQPMPQARHRVETRVDEIKVDPKLTISPEASLLAPVLWEAKDGTRYAVTGQQRVVEAQAAAAEAEPAAPDKPTVPEITPVPMVEAFLYREIDGWTAAQAVVLATGRVTDPAQQLERLQAVTRKPERPLPAPEMLADLDDEASAEAAARLEEEAESFRRQREIDREIDDELQVTGRPTLQESGSVQEADLRSALEDFVPPTPERPDGGLRVYSGQTGRFGVVVGHDPDSDTIGIRWEDGSYSPSASLTWTHEGLDLMRADLLEQRAGAGQGRGRTEGDILGAVQFDADNRAMIRVTEAADFDTWVHELAHVARRWMSPEDQERAARWAGAEDGQWSRAAEERFAEGLVTYLREGHVPHEAVRRVFERFTEWMRGIYAGTQQQLDDEIRNVYESILVSRSSPEVVAYAENREALGQNRRGAFTAPGTNRMFETIEGDDGRVQLDVLHGNEVLQTIHYPSREDMLRDVSGLPGGDRPFPIGDRDYRLREAGIPQRRGDDVEIQGERRPVEEVVDQEAERLGFIGQVKRHFWSGLRYPWLMELVSGSADNPLFNGLFRDINAGTGASLADAGRTRQLMAQYADEVGLSRRERRMKHLKEELKVDGWQAGPLSIGQGLSIVRHSRSPLNLRALRQAGIRMGSAEADVIRLSEEQIQAIVAATRRAVSPELYEFVTVKVDQVMDDIHRRLAPAVLHAEGRKLGYQAQYWAMEHAAADRQDVGFEDPTGLDYWRGAGHAPSVFRGMTMQRDEQARVPIVIRDFDFELARTVDHSARYVGYQIPLETARKLLSSAKLTAAIDKRVSGAEVVNNIRDTLIRVARQGEDDTQWERFRQRARRRVSTTILGGNPGTWVKQEFSVILYATYVQPKYLVAARAQAAIPGERSSLLEQHRAMDPEFAARGKGFDPDLATALQGSHVAEELGKRRITNAVMSGLRWFDQRAVTVGTQAAVMQGLEQMRTGNLSAELRRATMLTPEQAMALRPEERLQNAYAFARWVTQRTQPNFLPEMISAFQLRQPTLAMFSGYTNMARNLISMTYQRLRRDGLSDGEALRSAATAWTGVFIGNIAAAMVTDYLLAAALGRLPEEEELPSWAARRVITGVTAPWYIVRDISYVTVNGLHFLGGHGAAYFGTPLADAAADGMTAMLRLANEVIAGDEISEASVLGVLDLVGLGTGVPVGSPVLDTWLWDPLLF